MTTHLWQVKWTNWSQTPSLQTSKPMEYADAYALQHELYSNSNITNVRIVRAVMTPTTKADTE